MILQFFNVGYYHFCHLQKFNNQKFNLFNVFLTDSCIFVSLFKAAKVFLNDFRAFLRKNG
ncbi:MAG: hypothetical protein RIR11_3281 [Bacteroidota bacterium]|jgi:hypothetical protein